MNEAVKFLKGTQEQFETLCAAGKYQPGAFYLVIDDTASAGDNLGKPGRLYYGVNASNIAPVNQGITTVTTQGDLPTPSKINAGNFFYVEEDNIICISNGKGWVQANADTVLDSSTSTVDISPYVEGENQGVSIIQTISDTSGKQVEQTHHLIAGNNIELTGSNDKKSVTIDVVGINYELSSSLNATNNKQLDLVLKNGEEQAGPTVSILLGDNLNLTSTKDNQYELSLDNSVSTFEIEPNIDKSGFDISIGGSAVSGSSITNTLDPVIEYGSASKTSVKFINGKATLDVYTKSEIDQLNRTLNAMVYRGTITSISDAGVFVFGDEKYNVSNLHNGDVFIYNGDSDCVYDGHTIRPKDLFIATGEENDSGIISTRFSWVIIPAGDEPLVEIGDTLAEGNKERANFQICRGLEDLLTFEITGIEANEDAGIKADESIKIITSTNGTSKTVQFGHNTEKTADVAPTETLSTENPLTIEINDPAEIDDHGHVTKVTKRTYEISDTHAVIEEDPHYIDAIDNVATLIPKIKVDNASKDLAGIDIKSDTLIITGESGLEAGNGQTAKNASIKVELQWGTF